MCKRMVIILAILLAVGFSSPVKATPYTFQPNPVNLYNLDHGQYYKWGINWTVPNGEVITGATLFFNDIRNWDSNPNDLWVHLLPAATSGVTVKWDGQANGDAFDGQGTLLAHYHNLSNHAQDITYTFLDQDLAALISAVADGNFGLSFDPDCHYWNNGVTLTIEAGSNPVPEPATMFLFGTGLVGFAGFSLKRIKK